MWIALVSPLKVTILKMNVELVVEVDRSFFASFTTLS
jgi:hypothetical protein